MAKVKFCGGLHPDDWEPPKRKGVVMDEKGEKTHTGPLNCKNPECPFGKYREDATDFCCMACVGIAEEAELSKQGWAIVISTGTGMVIILVLALWKAVELVWGG